MHYFQPSAVVLQPARNPRRGKILAENEFAAISGQLQLITAIVLYRGTIKDGNIVPVTASKCCMRNRCSVGLLPTDIQRQSWRSDWWRLQAASFHSSTHECVMSQKHNFNFSYPEGDGTDVTVRHY